MEYSVNFLKKGIVRISVDKTKTDYLERYGIITPPTSNDVCDVELTDNSITLSNGTELKFSIRPDAEDKLWDDEINYQYKKFDNTLECYAGIIGAPKEDNIDKPTMDDIIDKGIHFGISFEIDRDEKFYGLGEGNRESIQHRGKSFQNLAVYQFNEIPIPFVVSNKNWGILINAENRHFVDIDDNIKDRLTIIGNQDLLDIYVLYGNSMKDVIARYTDITGKSMLLPKWAYGLTYIAPIHQNQWELMSDMAKFREKHIPCDNVSIEPGWMTKLYDYSFEKEWNQEKFHVAPWMISRDYPYTFISALRRMGYHTALWFCARYDFCDQEERKITGEGQIPAWYDHVKQFVDAGIDGFKLDPAAMLMWTSPQNKYTNGENEVTMHNISQVLLPRQVKEGYEEQMNMRPFLHYCGGYTGQQSCAAATTGDNDGGFGSMIWLLNLSMSGFMNSTVDMDVFNPQTIHYAMLAPWAHHNAWMGVGQPWYAGENCEKAYTNYARLRYSILPYIYSTAIECNETGIPMLRTMALEFQSDEECAELSKQYMMGENLLISAFTNDIYLPEGKWIDYWTGTEYDGNQWLTDVKFPEYVGGGLYIRKGAIIPRWSDRDYTTQYDDSVIQLHFYPCGNSAYTFREDDGTSLDYKTQNSCHTNITCSQNGECVDVVISARDGDYNGKVTNRIWEIYVHGEFNNVNVTCLGDSDSFIIK